MKLPTSRLKKIIKEELSLALENYGDYEADRYDPMEAQLGEPTGSGHYEICPSCNGEGVTRHISGDPQTEEMCPVCRGEGEIEVYE